MLDTSCINFIYWVIDRWRIRSVNILTFRYEHRTAVVAVAAKTYATSRRVPKLDRIAYNIRVQM
jgi:hypothetical protein